MLAYLANIVLKYSSAAARPARGSARRSPPRSAPVLPLGALHHLVRGRPGALARPAGGAALRDGGRHGAVAPLRRACTSPPTSRPARCSAPGWPTGSPREGRDPRPAERGQVVSLQRTHAGRRRGRQLPLHHRGAERGGGAGAATRGSIRSSRRISATPTVYETIEFHDIAGLVRGAHRGEGLGNRFLANIRETDALVHVVRAHDDEQVVHPEGRVDPPARRRDDRDRAALRRSRAGRAPAGEGGARGQVARQGEGRRGGVAARAGGALGEGQARALGAARPRRRRMRLRNLQPLTAKPVLYLANVGEGEPLEPPPELAAHAEARRRARRRGLGPPRGGALRARPRRMRRDARGARRRASRASPR